MVDGLGQLVFLRFVYLFEFKSVFVQFTLNVVFDSPDLGPVDDDHLFVLFFIRRKDEPDFIELLIRCKQGTAQIFLIVFAQHPESAPQADIDQIDNAFELRSGKQQLRSRESEDSKVLAPLHALDIIRERDFQAAAAEFPSAGTEDILEMVRTVKIES